MDSKKNSFEKEITGLERDLCQLHDMLKEENLSKKDMKQFLKPLRYLAYKGYFHCYVRTFICILIATFGLYYFAQIQTISWHLSAIGRIAMIQILPYWNWEKLAGERCLIRGFQETNEVTNFDCTLCESIDSIPVEKNLNPELLSEIYLDINVPVLITDGTKHWPFFNVQNLTEKILKNNVLSKSYPCDVSTNMVSSPLDVYQVLKKTEKFNKWFLHFQNCELNAAKAFRIFTPRPYFLKPEISPIQYSWLLMSKNYKFPNYKLINLSEKVTIAGQIDGSTYVRLVPRKNCFEKCPIVETKLEKGEVIVFGTLWDFEYKPFENSNNIAVILEA